MKGEPETVITTSLERRRNMEKMDIDYLVEYPFDDQGAANGPGGFCCSDPVRPDEGGCHCSRSGTAASAIREQGMQSF